MNSSKKIAVVTGANRGIGFELCRQLAKKSFKVILTARDPAKGEVAAKKLSAEGLDVGFQCLDVTSEESIQRFVSGMNQMGRLDVLINNAGMSMRALFEDVDLSVIRNLMDINFWGAVYCTKYALPSIIKSKGVVVGVSSIAGYRGLPGRTGYSASKFAMQGFLESLRTEMLHTGVHVMWVSPGFVASNIRNVALSSDGTAQAETPLDESKLMSAEECALIIINGIEKRKRSVVMTTQGKLTVLINKLFPSLADKLVYNHFLNEPDSPLKKYE